MRNCLRLDFSAFTFFISVFRNPDCRDAHAHDDVLSYAVFAGASDVLADPGRPSFRSRDDRFRESHAHNGLVDQQISLSPLRRFFFDRRMRSEPSGDEVEIVKGESAYLAAENKSFGLRRTLSIQRSGDGVIVREHLIRAGGPVTPAFSHLLAGRGSRLRESTVIHAATGCLLSYDVPAARAALIADERSPSYNRVVPAERLKLDLESAPEAVMVWRMMPRA